MTLTDFVVLSGFPADFRGRMEFLQSLFCSAVVHLRELLGRDAFDDAGFGLVQQLIPEGTRLNHDT